MQIARERDSTRQDILSEPQLTTAFGFRARMFPLFAFILGMVSYFGTYYVARSRNPPDVWPIPKTDILHTAIHYPEYLIYRVGMMVYPVLFCLSFQTLKYLIFNQEISCRSKVSN